MLSEQLKEHQSVEQFVKDKTDRQIAIMGLTIIDQHIKECADRWSRVVKLITYVGVGVGMIITERVANDIHWNFLGEFIKYAMRG